MDGIPKRRETHGLLFLRTYTRWSSPRVNTSRSLNEWRPPVPHQRIPRGRTVTLVTIAREPIWTPSNDATKPWDNTGSLFWTSSRWRACRIIRVVEEEGHERDRPMEDDGCPLGVPSGNRREGRGYKSPPAKSPMPPTR
jgi:hypothetical protein